MQKLVPMFGKESRRYFASPIGWVLILGAALLFGLGVAARDPSPLIGPVFALTHFRPTPLASLPPRVLLLIGMARVSAMCLTPFVTMRLFVEERRGRTLEMLFTSPVGDFEILLAKWLGAMCLYAAILALSAIPVAFSSRGADGPAIASAYIALAAQGAAVAAAGEAISAMTRHESAAAAGAAAVSVAVFRVSNSGILAVPDAALCLALTAAGWACTWQAIRKLRNAW